jgi:hypothetical protein
VAYFLVTPPLDVEEGGELELANGDKSYLPLLD